MINKKSICLLIFSLCVQIIQAQKSTTLITDTLAITLDNTEQQFLTQNLQLLAQRYNITVVKAQEIQARLYPNPNFSITSTFYNPAAKKVLPTPFSSDGEIAATISQQIILAGKINKNVKLAETNTRLAEYQFYDLIRTLKYSLRTTFYSIYYLMQNAGVYKLEIDNLQAVVNTYNNNDVKPFISEKERVRVKAQLYNLQNEYQLLTDQINDAESQIRLLLQEKTGVFVKPLINNEILEKEDPLKYSLATLLDSAYKGRTDLLIAKTNTDISKLNFAYQKALAVPDLTAGYTYDQQGAYIHNYSGLSLSIDLPFVNRNKGNIRAAKESIKQSEVIEQSTYKTVDENVFRALQKAIDADNLYKKIDPAFGTDYHRLVISAIDLYKKRDMALLDFLDFYDSYKQNTIQINAIKYNKIDALENINFYTGGNFFN